MRARRPTTPGSSSTAFTRRGRSSEDAYGLARTGQTIVNFSDGSIIRLLVDDEPLDLGSAGILRFERVLDMQSGVLCREIEFETARGRRMLVRSRRLASLEDRHFAAIGYEVVALDGPVSIEISSELVTHLPAESPASRGG